MRGVMAGNGTRNDIEQLGIDSGNETAAEHSSSLSRADFAVTIQHAACLFYPALGREKK
jgi:hypothetical protein